MSFAEEGKLIELHGPSPFWPDKHDTLVNIFLGSILFNCWFIKPANKDQQVEVEVEEQNQNHLDSNPNSPAVNDDS